MRDNSERIMDMLEAIERVEKYAQRGEVAFRSDELIQVYVYSISPFTPLRRTVP